MRKLLLLMLLFVPAMAQGDETEIEEPSGEPIEDEPPPPPAPKPDEGKVVPKAPLQARINAAIEKGVVWLKERQGKDGSYGPCIASHRYDSDEESDLALYYIGPTAFAVFTLRKCGVPRTDRTIKKSLKWLKKVCRKGWTPGSKRIDGTQFQGKGTYLYSSYESSAVIMMLVALNKKDVKRGQKPKPVKMSRSPGTPMSGFKKDEWMWMHERIQFLIDNPHNRMPSVQIRGGGWRYWPPYKKADQDLSATQFALLGLRAAVSAGYPVHMLQPKTWEWAAEAARSLQRGSGEFSYQRTTPWTAGMTAAGIACMLICREQITNMGQTPPAWMEKGAERGFEFLGKHLDFTKNTYGPGKSEGKKDGTGYHYYHLYGIERVGALSGKREIGGKAWYPRGADWLVGQQRANGAWVDDTCMRPDDVLGTCFALLFLKKATPPTVTVSGD